MADQEGVGGGGGEEENRPASDPPKVPEAPVRRVYKDYLTHYSSGPYLIENQLSTSAKAGFV